MDNQRGHFQFRQAGFQRIANIQVTLDGFDDAVILLQIDGAQLVKLLRLAFFQAGPTGIKAGFHGRLLAGGGLGLPDKGQFPLPHRPLRFLHIGHGVNQQQGAGQLRIFQGKLEGNGAAGRGTQDVRPVNLQMLQQGAQIGGVVGDGIALGRGSGTARGPAVVGNNLKGRRQGKPMKGQHWRATLAAAQAAVNQYQGRPGSAAHLVIHLKAVNFRRRHSAPPARCGWVYLMPWNGWRQGGSRAADQGNGGWAALFSLPISRRCGLGCKTVRDLPMLSLPFRRLS